MKKREDRERNRRYKGGLIIFLITNCSLIFLLALSMCVCLVSIIFNSELSDEAHRLELVILDREFLLWGTGAGLRRGRHGHHDKCGIHLCSQVIPMSYVLLLAFSRRPA